MVRTDRYWQQFGYASEAEYREQQAASEADRARGKTDFTDTAAYEAGLAKAKAAMVEAKGDDLTPWVEKIKPHLERSVEHIVAAGRELIEAKAALEHGRFGPLLHELGLSAEMARRFMRVAQHPALANRSRVTGLPSAIGTLDVLVRLDPDELDEAIESGDVTPTTTRAEAETVVQERTTEPEQVEVTPAPPVKPEVVKPDELTPAQKAAETRRQREHAENEAWFQQKVAGLLVQLRLPADLLDRWLPNPWAAVGEDRWDDIAAGTAAAPELEMGREMVAKLTPEQRDHLAAKALEFELNPDHWNWGLDLHLVDPAAADAIYHEVSLDDPEVKS
jgi:hypothetical protein